MINTLRIAQGMGYTKYFQEPFFEKAVDKLWDEEAVWTMGTTKHGAEKWYGMAGIPMASTRKEGEAPIIYDPAELGETTLTVQKHFVGIRATRESLMDARNISDLSGKIGTYLGESLSQARSYFLYLWFSRLTNATLQPCHDALAFCSSSHTLSDGSTYDNLFTATANTYDEVLEDFRLYKWGYRTHAGSYSFDDIATVMIGPSLWPTYQKIFENKAGQPDSMDRNDNFMYGKAKVVVVPFITSTTQRIYLGKQFKKHAHVLWRERMQTDQDADKVTQGVLFLAFQRLGYAVDDFLQVALNPGV
jgi:hypothetical protein